MRERMKHELRVHRFDGPIRIDGCSCGWRGLPANSDYDDQFAAHLAVATTMRHESLYPVADPSKPIQCICGWKPMPKIAAIDIDEAEALTIHCEAANYRPSLLVRPEGLTTSERVAEGLEPHGAWYPAHHVHDEIVYETLSQEITDAQIVRELHELWLPFDEREDFDRMVAGTPASLKVERIGGIHSDPFVRLIAFRAWGTRDVNPFLPRRFEGRTVPPAPIQPSSQPDHMHHQLGCADDDCDGQCIGG